MVLGTQNSETRGKPFGPGRRIRTNRCPVPTLRRAAYTRPALWIPLFHFPALWDLIMLPLYLVHKLPLGGGSSVSMFILFAHRSAQDPTHTWDVYSPSTAWFQSAGADRACW